MTETEKPAPDPLRIVITDRAGFLAWLQRPPSAAEWVRVVREPVAEQRAG